MKNTVYRDRNLKKQKVSVAITVIRNLNFDFFISIFILCQLTNLVMQLAYDHFAALADVGYVVASLRIQPVQFDHVIPSISSMMQ